ncbi:substrate-binding domain-containing protein [Yoonia sp.]|uniref:substrate-binding domain-containing protein n=1 Tax=Yoonia sp. TaxID=2212373 RepID=UPI002FD8F00B
MNLKELSKNLGLSQTTVSRALNGYPEVSDATRRRVEAAAKAFNYSPSNRAKGLATGRALAIGHVIPISTRHEMVNPVFGDFIAGAGETYSREGYEMVLAVVADADEQKVYDNMWRRRAVDGVVLHAPRMNDVRIPYLQKIGMPFAVHGRASGCKTPYTWLDVNNRRAFERATDFLIDLGHRRIALVNGLEYMDFADRRRAGYASALMAKDIPVDPTLMASGEMTEVFGYESMRSMLGAADPPTAVLCSSLVSALGARRAIEERGLKMGRDVSVVTHDDVLSYLQNGGETPIFTATRSSVREAGRRLAQMLLGRIAAPEGPHQQELLEAELVVGDSTGPAPRKD